MAARRFLRDLERALGPRPPFKFSASWANRACAFIETLPHVEDTWDTENLVLEPPQIFFVVQLFGFRVPSGRRYTEALYCIARKNAKSTLAAAILVTCLCLENVPGAQLLTAATTGDQARIVWGIAKKMVHARPQLKETFGVETFSKAIARYDTGSTMRAINSKASTQDGLNPSHTTLDEIHAHKTADLLNVLRSAAGGRGNPLWMFTTTEGYENAGPWTDLRNFARMILQRVLRADHFLALIFALDEEDEEDLFNESKWVKANPLITTNLKLRDAIRKESIDARAMPSAMAEFRIKRCNLQSSVAKGWVQLSKYMRCGGTLPDEELIGAPCYGAFDLSSTTDMTSWWMLFLVKGLFVLRGRYWVPEAAVAYRTERKTVPYASWVQQGLITQTAGEVVDYDIVKRDILEDWALFAPRKISYDPWNAASVANDLAAEGLPIEQFIQGPKSYHPAMKAFEIAYLSGRLRHASNPVLRWNFANMVARYDSNMNMAPDKKRSADKIDGGQCVIMTFGLAETDDAAGFDQYLNSVVSA